MVAIMRHCTVYWAVFLVLLDQSCVDPRLVFIQYIWKFIVIMGLEPDLISCPICGTPYNDKERLSFNTGLHTPCCGDCGDVDSEGFEYALGPGGRRYLPVYTRFVGIGCGGGATQRSGNHQNGTLYGAVR